MKRHAVRWGSLLLILGLFLFSGAILVRKIRQPELNSTLITAIKKNNAPAVTTALAQGADANATDLPLDSRPLSERIWDLMRGKSVKITAAPTALQVAMEYLPNEFPDEDAALVKALLDRQAVVNVVDRSGMTPLMRAADGPKKETARLLLEKRAAINAKDNSGTTPLHYAAASGDPALVQLLLSNGAQVNARANDGETPLHVAARSGWTAVVRLLMANRADVNARKADGSTPLIKAVNAGEEDCVELLMANGAHADIKDNDGLSALTWAERHHNARLVAMLKGKR